LLRIFRPRHGNSVSITYAKINRHNFLFLAFTIVFLSRVIQNLTFFFIPARIDYARYPALFQQTLLALSLIGLFLLFTQKTDLQASSSVKIWAWSVCFVIGLVIAIELSVNPLGIYPWNQSPVYLAGGARAIKLHSYKHLSAKPQIVVMGSSRADQLESGYIQQRFGKRAFNWTVEGSGPIDTLTSTNFLLEHNARNLDVLVVEISHILVSPAWRERTPIALIPYFPDFHMPLELIQAQLDYLFTFQALVESTFTYLYVYGRFPGNFYPDGTAKPETSDNESTYRKIIQDTSVGIGSQLRCIQLHNDGQEALDLLVKLAGRHKVGVVFYVSPMNADFLDTLDLKDPAYQKCSDLVGNYIADISHNHANVFYRNLTMDTALSDLRRKGFHDIEHLNKDSARQLIDTLAPEITKAIRWAESQRNQ
jgi:hypothetical protein